MTTPIVLITGALTGIGRATALAFAQEGAQLVVSGRREEEGEQLVAELRKLGAEAEFVRSDVRLEAEISSLSSDKCPWVVNHAATAVGIGRSVIVSSWVA